MRFRPFHGELSFFTHFTLYLWSYGQYVKEVKNCRNSMLLGLLRITSYVERENNFFSLVAHYYGH